MPEAKDPLLDDYLAGNSELSRRYREAATESSPAGLDEQILRAARRELRPRPRRWMLPLSMAAAVLLSMSVILRLPQESIAPEPPQQSAAAPTMAALPATDAPAASAQQKAAAPPRLAPAASASAPASAPTAEPFANSAADSAPAAEGKQEAAPQISQPAAEKVLGAERQRAPSAAGMLAPRRDEASPAATEERDALTPASWIARIRELRRSGKPDEAAAELKKFRAHYPDYVLPPHLLTEDVRP
jgi:hypothetical protein